MSTKNRFGFTALLLAVGPLFVVAANAQAPVTLDAGTAEDAGASDAGADGDADAGPVPLPAFDLVPFSAEASERPKKEEWKGVPEVAFSPGSQLPSACKAYRLREWIRIRCETTSARIRLMCGDAQDVAVRLDPMNEDSFFPEGGELVFPVRKGDRRLFEWTGIEWGYKWSNTAISLFVLSEMWLPGEEKPTILVR